jgi:hypothetical protein
MRAKLTINFTDGSSKVIDLGESCIELDVSAHRKQSVGVQQVGSTKFKLAFTKPLMEGKQFESIIINKVP